MKYYSYLCNELKKNVMKNLLLLLVIVLSFAACNKQEPLVPMEQVPDAQYQDSITNPYINGGTLPTGTSNGDNQLVGTSWVLTKMVSSFATEYPNDTINFVSNTEYTLNGGAVRPYQLNSLPSSTNYDLSLYYFMSFGGSHYSGNVGFYFVDDAEINNVEFTDIQSTSTTIRAWFTKL